MARVSWSRRALANLNAIFAYIHGDSPRAAAAVFFRLRRAADALDIQPNRGRPIGGGRRELTHVHPYLIRYRVTARRVEILEVRHGARKPGVEEGAVQFDAEAEPAPLTLTDEEEEALLEAEADADAGRVVPHSEVAKWLATWGTPDETPPPFSWRK